MPALHAPFRLPSMAPQFIRYAGAGAVGTAAHLYTHSARSARKADAVAARPRGLAGAVINYALNHRFSLRADGRTDRFARFCVVAAPAFCERGSAAAMLA